MKGFFVVTKGSKAPLPLVPRCGACGLYKNCLSPKMPYTGEGRKKVLIIGEAPGKTEDVQNKQFVGEAGQRLNKTLVKLGIDFRRDCYITNSFVCHPKGNKIPSESVIDHCRPNVIKTIEETNPEVIILLGKSAVKSVIGWLWKEDIGTITRWVGWKIPSQRLNTWICPTYHPSFLLRNEKSKASDKVNDIFFEEHLRNAFALKGRPWKKMPDFSKKVERIYSSEEACKAIKEITNAKEPIAVDFETDRLKPDHQEATIHCCSVSNGARTIAFPFSGKVVQEVKEILSSELPKIGYHQKFETRWALRKLKIFPQNWIHDGMLAAHVLDNREGITSLKFQSFVLLGQPSYNDHIEPFFKTKNSNEKNRIKDIPMDDLLLYCGLDAYLEWRVAKIQMKELNNVSL